MSNFTDFANIKPIYQLKSSSVDIMIEIRTNSCNTNGNYCLNMSGFYNRRVSLENQGKHSFDYLQHTACQIEMRFKSS